MTLTQTDVSVIKLNFSSQTKARVFFPGKILQPSLIIAFSPFKWNNNVCLMTLLQSMIN